MHINKKVSRPLLFIFGLLISIVPLYFLSYFIITTHITIYIVPQSAPLIFNVILFAIFIALSTLLFFLLQKEKTVMATLLFFLLPILSQISFFFLEKKLYLGRKYYLFSYLLLAYTTLFTFAYINYTVISQQ